MSFSRRFFLTVTVMMALACAAMGQMTKSAAPVTQPAASEAIESGQSRVRIRSNGTLESLDLSTGGAVESVKFRNDALSGPTWADVALQREPGAAPMFSGSRDNVRHTIAYELSGNRLLIHAGLKNEGQKDFQPKAARLVLGIDCAMLKCPEWNEAYFPTLMRCEPTHFWGYFMTPRGKILTIGCAEPVASYHLNDQRNIWGQGDRGHMIFTVSLDMLHALPLPPRHSQDLLTLKPGQERTWTIVLEPAPTLEAIKPMLASRLGAPMIDADRYTLAAGKSARVKVWSATPITAAWTTSNGSPMPIAFRASALVVVHEPGEKGIHPSQAIRLEPSRTVAGLDHWCTGTTTSCGRRVGPADRPAVA